jgi:hypothetical protein
MVLNGKRSLAALITLIFLLSPNALLFATHAALELQLAVNYPLASEQNPHPEEHHHAHCQPDGQGGEAPDQGCCSSHLPHSHDLAQAPVPALVFSAPLAPFAFLEPAVFLPEVFLDPFVPPQNPA